VGGFPGRCPGLTGSSPVGAGIRGPSHNRQQHTGAAAKAVVLVAIGVALDAAGVEASGSMEIERLDERTAVCKSRPDPGFFIVDLRSHLGVRWTT
jgi:hypothetical protein